MTDTPSPQQFSGSDQVPMHFSHLVLSKALSPSFLSDEDYEVVLCTVIRRARHRTYKHSVYTSKRCLAQATDAKKRHPSYNSFHKTARCMHSSLKQNTIKSTVGYIKHCKNAVCVQRNRISAASAISSDLAPSDNIRVWFVTQAATIHGMSIQSQFKNNIFKLLISIHKFKWNCSCRLWTFRKIIPQILPITHANIIKTLILSLRKSKFYLQWCIISSGKWTAAVLY